MFGCSGLRPETETVLVRLVIDEAVGQFLTQNPEWAVPTRDVANLVAVALEDKEALAELKEYALAQVDMEQLTPIQRVRINNLVNLLVTFIDPSENAKLTTRNKEKAQQILGWIVDTTEKGFIINE